MHDHREKIERAAAAIEEADALLITAGAGMGVDSGLPDFRGNQGFWRAYPPLERLGISFVEMADPAWFDRDPELAWGFYGHRLNLYRATPPHRGFQLVHAWAQKTGSGPFVFTSNVDGHFHAAGFDEARILECHGSIHHLQCSSPCGFDIWPADDTEVEVDETSFRATTALPPCPACGAVARPNILMFGDWAWIHSRSGAQEQRFARWMDQTAGTRVVVMEIGAGTAVPTVRMTSERAAARTGGTLIRINPREPQVPGNHLGIAAPALETLEAINQRL